MNLVERLRGYASGRILMNSEEVDALVTEAADALEEPQREDDLGKTIIRFEKPGRTWVEGEGYKWEPQRWWDIPRVDELVNLPPHNPKAYVNTDMKALYRVKQVEYVRDGEVTIRVEGPLNG